MTAQRALLLFGLGLPSCATTSGREWLEAPLEPRAPSSHAGPAFTVAEEAVEARPRLRHTVTLGESYAAVPQATAAAAGPAVQVNVTNNIPVIVHHPIGYGYGYGYGYGARGYGVAPGSARFVGAPLKATPSMPTKVGGDFPPPPDHGPRALR